MPTTTIFALDLCIGFVLFLGLAFFVLLVVLANSGGKR